MFERRSRNRHERVERDGLDAELLKGECHIEAILPRLPHADDAAGADAESLCLRHLDRADAVGVAVRRADLREVALGSLDVVMIARHADLAQAAELAAREESVRGTQLDRERAPHLLVGVERLLKLRTRERTARGDDGEAVCARILICLCVRDDLLLREKVVGVNARFVTPRLRTVFAVLAAAPAAPVDNCAQVDMIAAELFLQAICPLAQFLDRRVHKDGAVVLAAHAVARDNLSGELCNTMFAHKKIPAS